jgi:hypothetical protein
MNIHIHAPQATHRQKARRHCPTCAKRTTFVAFNTPWYGWDSTCLRCGDSWSDMGEMRERPFAPGWRKRSIEAAQKRWRDWNQAAADAAWKSLLDEIGGDE